MKNQYSILTWTTKKVQNDGRNIEIHLGGKILAGFIVRTAFSCHNLDFLVNLLSKPLYLHIENVDCFWAGQPIVKHCGSLSARGSLMDFHFRHMCSDMKLSKSKHTILNSNSQTRRFISIWFTHRKLFLYSKPWMVNGEKFVCDCPNPPTHTSHHVRVHVVTQHGPGLNFAILSNYSSVYSSSRSCPKTVSRTREVFPTGSTTLLRLQLWRTRDCAHRFSVICSPTWPVHSASD